WHGVFFGLGRRPPSPSPFPYTPLFRSRTPPAPSPRARQRTPAPDRGRRKPGRGHPTFFCRRMWSASLAMTMELVGQLLLLPTPRSEEHTSELQSRENLVCRLLLEKKNQ